MSPGITMDAAHDEATSTEEATEEVVTETAEAAAVSPARPAGELDSGSVTHSLAAGDRSVVIDYWTAQEASTWTAEDAKTVQLSAHVEGGENATVITVTRFVTTADDGASRTVVAEDRGEFALTPPFSYTTALSLPESSTDATSVTLYVQFDLLVETEPGSERFYRQTVLDTLELPLLQEDPQ
ncbi:hypothetical protein [Geodermatophilus ruber]|uniref:Uncharacterized protein n=1 Tax=Geodermatophilus ruber TaxID=504800 RepID=A0A1I4EPZ1_9ACTN|nr:hypothetical protein [Geodermatophilus ruber]SFL06546.1 hypothetical protein SAMN04488085_10684 [Geodermatophilus ruber]